ncbi:MULTISPECIES: hypothetical protein [Microbacterium]|uniref:hypothetical protein n=1 Tax=Microbacterium TaxID=33882 RepID=UPI00168B64DE|nr:MULTISPECIES: hypothetical protein [Microbacterium]QOC26698.1 hypothetical protein IC745_04670 [Microbacterium hominis]QYF96974.1 hypothetical protein KY498_12475 [Microbacterium sp. PAMC21962]
MTGAHADLWWLPVGAGGRVVVRTSRWWESLRALRARRAPRPLFHAALEVFDGEAGYVIEMTPAWGGPVGPRGVVAEGPVGSRRLGGSRLFRYEIRCWKDGVIPDRRWAVEPPRRLALSPAAAGALIARVGSAPRFVWGRDPFGIGDMWNSNSLVAWLLEGSGIDTAEIAPPRGGDAPGWRCGAVAARRGLRS